MPPEISGAQDGLFKAIAGHGIRKVLRFQAQGAARRIYCALLAAAFGQEICGVELHARQRRPHRHGDAGRVAAQYRRRFSGQAEVVVVPAAVSQLDIVRADILPDALRRTEVKGRSGDRQPLPGRQRRRAVFQKLFGAVLQRVAEHGTAAVKIKIAVIRQIAKGIPIGRRFIRHRQRIPAQAIAHGGAHRAGIPLFPIRRYAREPYAVRQHFRRPYIFIKAAHAAVQMVLPVVSGEPVVFPVQREGRAADAVADTSNARAEIAVVFLVFPERIIAKDCVRPRAAMMQTQMNELGYENVFIGTVEGEPEETACEEVIKAVAEAGYTKVVLRPLMVVAGDHANNDMAGEDEDSWLSQFNASGKFDSVDTQIAGLGGIKAIQDLYVAHTAAAMAEK